MSKYIIVHTKHNGCYDRSSVLVENESMCLTSVTINYPEVFCFDEKDQALDFFDRYINDVDVIDVRCRKPGGEIQHLDFCTCGIIEMDRDGNTVLFYNKRNQIFLLEQTATVMRIDNTLRESIQNMNLTNDHIRRARTLTTEQRRRYVELGRTCKESLDRDAQRSRERKEKEAEEPEGSDTDNIVLSCPPCVPPVPPTTLAADSACESSGKKSAAKGTTKSSNANATK